jgi:hypothetical chaperone protein
VSLYCGVDFGTSNSVITLVDGTGSVQHAIREPSLLYFPEQRETTVERYCGSAARDGWVSGGMRGRFFQSVKTLLPDEGFTGTLINGKRFSAEDLVAVMLRYLRTRMEGESGAAIRRAVIGRPARFSDKDPQDALAQKRLETAARQAGFEEVAFELEPIAGAHAYGLRSSRSSTVFVSDHGGGTSDFTIMDIAFEDGVPLPNHKHVRATHGVRVGGDDFDADIMWTKLVSYFGSGTSYESWGKMLPIPVHIYRTLCRWDRIHLLKSISYHDELRYFRNGASDPAAIERLIALIEEDLGFFLFQAIEKAKFDLSEVPATFISFRRGAIDIESPILVDEFSDSIEARIRQLDGAIERTLELANIGNREVSNVFLTGGSSRAQPVRDLLVSRFGEDRVLLDSDQFNSVGTGLAIAARERELSIA